MTRRGTPQPYSLGVSFSLDQPLDFEDAREAAHAFATQRQEARQMLESAYGELAQAEADYRRARRSKRASAEGDTAKARDEVVDAETADARQARDEANFKIKLIQERLAEIDGTRASFHKLLEWSARVDPDASEDRSVTPAVQDELDRRRAAAR